MAAYATRAEMYTLAVPSAALAGISTSDQDSALESASRVADSYLSVQFELPITACGIDLKEAVCKMAAYRLLSVRGFSPEQGDAEQYRLQYEDGRKWLEQVSQGKVRPTSIVDSDTEGSNNTDAAGAALEEDFVVQPTSSTVTPESFFSQGGDTVVTPKKRGW